MCSVGRHDEIERTVPGTCLVDHRCPAAIAHDVNDLRIGDQAGRLLPQPAVQQLEQRTAMDPQPKGRGMQVGISEIEDRMLQMIEALQSVDPGAQPLRLLIEAEPAQHGEAGRLQKQAGPRRPGFGKALEDGNAMAFIGEQGRCRLAGDTATDNANL